MQEKHFWSEFLNSTCAVTMDLRSMIVWAPQSIANSESRHLAVVFTPVNRLPPATYSPVCSLSHKAKLLGAEETVSVISRISVHLWGCFQKNSTNGVYILSFQKVDVFLPEVLLRGFGEKSATWGMRLGNAGPPQDKECGRAVSPGRPAVQWYGGHSLPFLQILSACCWFLL